MITEHFDQLRDIDSIGISFAVSREGNRLVPVKDARVYNYLPTELRLDFGFMESHSLKALF
jgi:hypothetical protein